MAPIIGRLLLSKGAFFFYGTVVGPLLSRAYEPAGAVVRGAAKTVIKTGIAMGGAVQKAVVKTKEGIEDITAEAKSELTEPKDKNIVTHDQPPAGQPSNPA